MQRLLATAAAAVELLVDAIAARGAADRVATFPLRCAVEPTMLVNIEAGRAAQNAGFDQRPL